MRIGIDLGGTKIEGIVLDRTGAERARMRIPTPQVSDGDGYEPVLRAVADLVAGLEARAGGERCSVGIGTPGFLSPATGLIINSNLSALNGKPVDRDLSIVVGRPVRVDNDANCFVLSEAADGAAAAAVAPAAAGRIHVVFGATLGTGVGGGVVIDGRVLNGANGSAGEWSHTTLPFARDDERSPYPCSCGHPRCIESFISGRGLAGAYREATGQKMEAPEVGQLAAGGDAGAATAFAIYEDRLARALAGVINLLDPHIIVLGGGVSNNTRIFDNVPKLLERYTVPQGLKTKVVRAHHGDASGTRGAAWLWPQ